MKGSSSRPGRLSGTLILLMLCGLIWRGVVSYYIIPDWESSRHLVPFPDNYPALARSLIAPPDVRRSAFPFRSPTVIAPPEVFNSVA